MKLRLVSQLVPLLLSIFCAALAPAALAAAHNTATVPVRSGKMIFLTFTVTTQPPQEHLRAGLTSILASRLEERTGLDAVHGADKTAGLEAMLAKGSQQDVKKILSTMQGDYLLTGSLEQQKSGYELLIHVFSSKKAAPASFKRSLETLDSSLPALDSLAIEIADKVFQQTPQPEEEPLPVAAAMKKDGTSGFQTAHPDKAWRDGLYATAGAADASAAAATGSGPFNLLNSLHSGELELSLKALDAGDLDGDGREEVVLLEQGRLLLCRFSADRFQQLGELALPGYLAFHALHLMDMNHDRRQEIYVSASNGDAPSSLVLAWDGKAFHIVHEQVPFYFRPDMDSAGKPVLLGQDGSGIYRMTVGQDGSLRRAEDVQLPRGFGLYDFIRVDLDGDGRREFVGLTEENNLVVLDQEGRPLWKSSESYGASKEMLGTLASKRQAELDHRDSSEPLYLHSRIVAQDMTGDGRPEIIIGRNHVTNIKYLKRLRWFEGSSLAVLHWDGSRMNTLWETKQTPAYTVDYQILPSTEQPGRFRLFAAESNDSGNPLYFWAKEKTIIRMQELTGMAAAANKR